MSGERAAFVGRFQPYHVGHHRVIEEYRPQYDEFVIVVGSAETARTPSNPLTADERERILRACQSDVELRRLADEDRGEAGYVTWARRLESLSDADIVISRNALVIRLVREYTTARIVQQTLHDPDRFSGTEVRRRIRADEDWEELVPACARDVIADLQAIIRNPVRPGD